MRLTLLGTAAAEGWPAPFCACDACEEARRRGGPNLRTRSNALLDGDLKIDWGADTMTQLQRARLSLEGLRTLVFTHQHDDHIVPCELNWAISPFSQTPPARIAVYGNAQVLARLHAQFPDASRTPFEFHKLKAGREEVTAEGDSILPLEADHVEGAMTLLIRRGGKSLFYGHDSGLYPRETLAALEAHSGEHGALSIVLMDCTNGGQSSSNRGHMGTDGVAQMKRELRDRGAIDERTRVIATHFSHNGGLGHEELTRTLSADGIEAAFDGMTVEV